MVKTNDVGLKCLKYMLLFANILFIGIGILTILLGESIVSIYNDLDIFLEDHHFSPALLIISIGMIIMIVSLLGCVGAIVHSTMIVNIYTLFMCILLVLEVSAIITAFVKRRDIVSFVDTSMRDSMSFYKNDTEVAETWNLIQEEFSCCGVHNYADWSDYSINEATIVVGDKTFGIPKTCCVNKECKSAFSRGCLDYISSVTSESGFLLAIGATCIAIVQLLGIVFGNMLVKTIRRVKSTEEMIRQQRNMLYDQINNGRSTIYD